MGRMRIKKGRSKAKEVSGERKRFKEALMVHVEGCDLMGELTLCSDCPYLTDCDLEFALNEDFGTKEP